MRITFVCTFFLSFIVASFFAQVNGGQHEKLRELYNLEKYEACLLKADKMVESGNYDKDPEPALYMTMCFHKLHQANKENIESPYYTGLRDALKYALKFKFKDRSGDLYNQNISFIEELELASVNEVSYYAGSSDFRKSGTLMGSLLRFNNHVAFEYYNSVLGLLSGNKSTQKSIDKCLSFFSLKADSLANDKSMNDAKIMAIQNATLFYCDYLKSNNLKDQLRSVITTIHNTLPKSDEITLYYNQVFGIKSEPTTKNGLKIIKTTDVSTPEANEPVVEPVE